MYATRSRCDLEYEVTIEKDGEVKTRTIRCQKPLNHLGCCMANISLSPPQIEVMKQKLKQVDEDDVCCEDKWE